MFRASRRPSAVILRPAAADVPAAPEAGRVAQLVVALGSEAADDRDAAKAALAEVEARLRAARLERDRLRDLADHYRDIAKFDADAARIGRLTTAVAEVPGVAEALHAGNVGVAQANELAVAHANPGS